MDFNSNGGLVNWTFQQHDERITMRHEFIAGEELKCKSLRQNGGKNATRGYTNKTNRVGEKVRTQLLPFSQTVEKKVDEEKNWMHDESRALAIVLLFFCFPFFVEKLTRWLWQSRKASCNEPKRKCSFGMTKQNKTKQKKRKPLTNVKIYIQKRSA